MHVEFAHISEHSLFAAGARWVHVDPDTWILSKHVRFRDRTQVQTTHLIPLSQWATPEEREAAYVHYAAEADAAIRRYRVRRGWEPWTH